MAVAGARLECVRSRIGRGRRTTRAAQFLPGLVMLLSTPHDRAAGGLGAEAELRGSAVLVPWAASR